MAHIKMNIGKRDVTEQKKNFETKKVSLKTAN